MAADKADKTSKSKTEISTDAKSDTKSDKKSKSKTETSTDAKSDTNSDTKSDAKVDKMSGETKSKTVNPEGQKRVTKSYLQGWDRIWGKKR